MSEHSEFRKDLFPSGYCVSPDDPHPETGIEVFEAIDQGEATAQQLIMAKQACTSCVQFSYCSDQNQEIAVELWKRGVGLTVVGGKQFTVQPKAAGPALEAPGTFEFDLAKIPTEPELALPILRQGWRSGQLIPGGPTPTGAKTIRARYLERVQTKNPDLYRQAQNILGEAETIRSVQLIATAIFQQKDFHDFSNKKQKSNLSAKPRYDAETFDMDESGPLVDLFLAETIRIKQLGISKPANKATLFAAEFYENLVTHYKNDSINWSDFNGVLANNRRDPVQAFERREARIAALRAKNPEASESFVRQAARLGRTATEQKTVVAELSEHYKDAAGISEGIIKSVAATGSENAQKIIDGVVERAAVMQKAFGTDHPILTESDFTQFAKNYRTVQGCAEALNKFISNVHELERRYSEHPDMSKAAIRRFSQGYLDSAVTAAETYLETLEELRAQSDGTISQGQLKVAAKQGITSFSEAQRSYKAHLLNDRHKKRVKHTGEKLLRPTTVRHVASLYPISEIEAVSEATYRLANDGYLVEAHAEAPKLMGAIDVDLKKIFTSKREYVTFAGSLDQLSMAERVALASHHGLTPLIYGIEVSDSLAMFLLGESGTLEEYYRGVLEPKCQSLVEHSQTNNALPFSVVQEDLRSFKQHNASSSAETREYASLRGVRDVTLVVGGHALYLREPGHNWSENSEDAEPYRWLEYKIASLFPPQEQADAYDRACDALRAGTIELVGDSFDTYRAVFSKTIYDSGVTDLERTVIANSLGIDHLLYGADLTQALRYRLGEQVMTVTIQRHQQPEIIEFTDDELAQQAATELQYEIGQREAAIAEDPLGYIVTHGLRAGEAYKRLSVAQQAAVTKALMTAFSQYLEHPNHRAEILGYEGSTYLAWEIIQGNGPRAAARMFSIPSEEVSTFLVEGVDKIIEVVGQLSEQQFKPIKTLLTPPVQERSSKKRHTVSTYQDDIEHTKKNLTRSSDHVPKSRVRTKPAGKVVEEVKAPDYFDADVLDLDEERKPTRAPKTVSEEADFTVDGISRYLRRIGKIKLLTADEEVELAKGIEAGVFAEERLATQDYTLGTREELQRLVDIGRAAKTRMIEANLRLVISQAKRYRTAVGHLKFFDYVDEGNIGLIRAVEKFDYKQGYKFSTYATWWINQAISRAKANLDDTIRTPVHVYEFSRQVRVLIKDYIEEHGVEPTTELLADQTGKTIDQIEDARRAIKQQPTSINITMGDDGDAEIGDLIYDENAQDPGETAIDSLTRQNLQRVLREVLLANKELETPGRSLILKFGLPLDDNLFSPEFIATHSIIPGKAYTKEALSVMFGVHRITISNWEKRVLEALRDPEVLQRLATT